MTYGDLMTSLGARLHGSLRPKRDLFLTSADFMGGQGTSTYTQYHTGCNMQVVYFMFGQTIAALSKSEGIRFDKKMILAYKT